MSDERPGDSQAEGAPPPSPLTGAYLLIVLPQLHSPAHKDRLLHALTKGLITWDAQDCHVDLDKELQNITAQAPEGEEAKNGERLIQFASENLVTEVLIHPQLNTLLQCMRNCLSSFTRHRHIVHAGYTSTGNGAWVLQDGTYSFSDFADMYSEHEVQRVLRAYEGTVSVDVHCSGEGDWWALKAKDPFSKVSRVRLNPPDKVTTTEAVRDFLNYLSQYLVTAGLNDLLEPSDVVGNIRFSHPTLYVFPGGQGDAALFGINGFNMLVDGGFSRKACFWDFTRHLDRLDSVLMTRINNGNFQGLTSLLRRKKSEQVYPQIGHFFSNIPDRRQILSPDGDKDRDPLLVNLIEQGQEMLSGLRHLGLKPQPCYREPSVEPINLYHKVGHGKLDMYVLSPAKDSREVREFLAKWAAVDSKIFCSYSRKGEFNFPLSSKASICALLVWQPANPEDNITRLLFPGSTPQQKIFEGLDRLKNLEFMKHPVCSAKSLSPSSSTMKLSIKAAPKPALIEKVAEIEKKQSETVKAVKQVGEIKKLTPLPPKPKPKAERPKEKPKTDLDSKPETIKIDKKNTEAVQKVEKEIKKEKPKRAMHKPPEKKMQKPPEKKTDSIKSSPTTPKKTVENKLTEMAVTKTETKPRASRAKASPTATPAKSAKEENNRKVVERRESNRLQKAPLHKKEEPKKIEKTIGKKTAASPKGLKSLSPIKAAKPPMKQRLDVKKTSKTEKDIITDSSAVSTPSTVDAELTKAKEETEKTREMLGRKSEDISRKASEDIGKSISKEEDDEILIIEKVEITGKADLEKIALHLQKVDEDKKKIPKEELAMAIEEKEIEETLTKEKTTKVSEVAGTEDTKQVAEEEVEEIIETATEIVTKKLDTQKTDSQEVSGKDVGSAEKIITPKEKDMKSVEVEQKIDESQPDERFSTTVESGATTTAPTLPEDERIPLDEIKEGIEEKYIKEETKEKEVIATPRPEQLTSLPQVPIIAGTVFDQRAQLLKDIVKTPDEVADLPVHEEVDGDIYEGTGKDELLNLPASKKEKRDEVTEEKLFKDNLEKEDKSKDLKEDMVESVDVLSHTTTDLDLVSSSPKSGKPLESEEKEEEHEDEKKDMEKEVPSSDQRIDLEQLEKKQKTEITTEKILDVEQSTAKSEDLKEITEKETIESKEKDETKFESTMKLELQERALTLPSQEVETEKDEGVCLEETTPQLESKDIITLERDIKDLVPKQDVKTKEETEEHILPKDEKMKDAGEIEDKKSTSSIELTERKTSLDLESDQLERERVTDKEIKITLVDKDERALESQKMEDLDDLYKEIEKKTSEIIKEQIVKDEKLLLQETDLIKTIKQEVIETKSTSEEAAKPLGSAEILQEKKDKIITTETEIETKVSGEEIEIDEIEQLQRKIRDFLSPEKEAKPTSTDAIDEITKPELKETEAQKVEELKKDEEELHLDRVVDENKIDKLADETLIKPITPKEKTLAVELAETKQMQKEEDEKVKDDKLAKKIDKVEELIAVQEIKEVYMNGKTIDDSETRVEEISEGISGELKEIIKSDENEIKIDNKEESIAIETSSISKLDDGKPKHSDKLEGKNGMDKTETDESKDLIKRETEEIKRELEESIKTEIHKTVEDISLQKVVTEKTVEEEKEHDQIIEKEETGQEITETGTETKIEKLTTSSEIKPSAKETAASKQEGIGETQPLLVNGLTQEEMQDMTLSEKDSSKLSEYEIKHISEETTFTKESDEHLEIIQKESSITSSEVDGPVSEQKKEGEVTASPGVIFEKATSGVIEQVLQKIDLSPIEIEQLMSTKDFDLRSDTDVGDMSASEVLKEKLMIEEELIKSEVAKPQGSKEEEDSHIVLADLKKTDGSEEKLIEVNKEPELVAKEIIEVKESIINETKDSQIKLLDDETDLKIQDGDEIVKLDAKTGLETKKTLEMDGKQLTEDTFSDGIKEPETAEDKIEGMLTGQTAVDKKKLGIKSTEENEEAKLEPAAQQIIEKQIQPVEFETKIVEEKIESEVKTTSEIKLIDEKKEFEVKLTEEKMESHLQKAEDVKTIDEKEVSKAKSVEETIQSEMKPAEKVKSADEAIVTAIKSGEEKLLDEIKGDVEPLVEIKHVIDDANKIKETTFDRKERVLIDKDTKEGDTVGNKDFEIMTAGQKKDHGVKLSAETTEVTHAKEIKHVEIKSEDEKKVVGQQQSEEEVEVELKLSEDMKQLGTKLDEEKKQPEIRPVEEKLESEIISVEEDNKLKSSEEKDFEVKTHEKSKEIDTKETEEKKDKKGTKLQQDEEIKLSEGKEEKSILKTKEIEFTTEETKPELKLDNETTVSEPKPCKKESEIKSTTDVIISSDKEILELTLGKESVTQHKEMTEEFTVAISETKGIEDKIGSEKLPKVEIPLIDEKPKEHKQELDDVVIAGLEKSETMEVEDKEAAGLKLTSEKKEAGQKVSEIKKETLTEEDEEKKTLAAKSSDDKVKSAEGKKGLEFTIDEGEKEIEVKGIVDKKELEVGMAEDEKDLEVKKPEVEKEVEVKSTKEKNELGDGQTQLDILADETKIQHELKPAKELEKEETIQIDEKKESKKESYVEKEELELTPEKKETMQVEEKVLGIKPGFENKELEQKTIEEKKELEVQTTQQKEDHELKTGEEKKGIRGKALGEMEEIGDLSLKEEKGTKETSKEKKSEIEDKFSEKMKEQEEIGAVEKKEIELKLTEEILQSDIESTNVLEQMTLKEKKDPQIKSVEQAGDVKEKAAEEKKDLETKLAEVKHDLSIKPAVETKDDEKISAEKMKDTAIESDEDRKDVEIISPKDKKDSEIKSSDERKDSEVKSAEVKADFALKPVEEAEQIKEKAVEGVKDPETKLTEEKKDSEIKSLDERKDSEVKSAEVKADFALKPVEEGEQIKEKAVEGMKEQETKLTEEKKDSEIKSLDERKHSDVKSIEGKDDFAIKSVEEAEEIKKKAVDGMKDQETKLTEEKKDSEIKSLDEMKDSEVKSAELKEDFAIKSVEEAEEIKKKAVEEMKSTETKLTEEKKDSEIKSLDERKDSDLKSAEVKEDFAKKSVEEAEEIKKKAVEEMKSTETKLTEEKKDSEIKSLDERKDSDLKSAEVKEDFAKKSVEKAEEIKEKAVEGMKGTETKLTEEKKDSDIKSLDERKDSEVKSDEIKEDFAIKSVDAAEKIEEEVVEGMKGTDTKLTEEKKDSEIKSLDERKDSEVKSIEEKDDFAIKSVDAAEKIEEEVVEGMKGTDTKLTEEKKDSEIKSLDEIKDSEVKSSEGKEDFATKSVKGAEQIEEKAVEGIKGTESKLTEEKKDSEIKSLDERKDSEVKSAEVKEDFAIKSVEEAELLKEKAVDGMKDQGTKLTEEKKDSEIKSSDERKDSEVKEDFAIKSVEEAELLKEKAVDGIKDQETKLTEEKKDSEIKSSDERKYSEVKEDFAIKSVEEAEQIKEKAVEGMKEPETKLTEEKKDSEIKSLDERKDSEVKSADVKEDFTIKSVEKVERIKEKAVEGMKDPETKLTEEKKASEIKSSDERKDFEVKSPEVKADFALKPVEEAQQIKDKAVEGMKDPETKLTEEKKDSEIKSLDERKDFEVKSPEVKADFALKPVEEAEQIKEKAVEGMKEPETKLTEEKKDLEIKSLDERIDSDLKSAEVKEDFGIKSVERAEEIKEKAVEGMKGTETKLTEEKKDLEIKSFDEKKDSVIKSAEEKKDSETKSAEEVNGLQILSVEEVIEMKDLITKEKKDISSTGASATKELKEKEDEDSQEPKSKTDCEVQPPEIKKIEVTKETMEIYEEKELEVKDHDLKAIIGTEGGKKEIETKPAEEKKKAESISAEETKELEGKLDKDKTEAEFKPVDDKKELEIKPVEEKELHEAKPAKEIKELQQETDYEIKEYEQRLTRERNELELKLALEGINKETLSSTEIQIQEEKTLETARKISSSQEQSELTSKVPIEKTKSKAEFSEQQDLLNKISVEMKSIEIEAQVSSGLKVTESETAATKEAEKGTTGFDYKYDKVSELKLKDDEEKTNGVAFKVNTTESVIESDYKHTYNLEKIEVSCLKTEEINKNGIDVKLQSSKIDEKENIESTITNGKVVITEGSSFSTEMSQKEDIKPSKPTDSELPKAEKGSLDSSIKETKTEKIESEIEAKESTSGGEQFLPSETMEFIEKTKSSLKEYCSTQELTQKEPLDKKVNGFTSSKVTTEVEEFTLTCRTEESSEISSSEQVETSEIKSVQKQPMVSGMADLTSSVKGEKDTANADLKSKMEEEKQVDQTDFKDQASAVEKTTATNEELKEQITEYSVKGEFKNDEDTEEQCSFKYTNGDRGKSQKLPESSKTLYLSEELITTSSEEQETLVSEKTIYSNGKMEQVTDDIKTISEEDKQFLKDIGVEDFTSITITKTTTTSKTTDPDELTATGSSRNGSHKRDETVTKTETKYLFETDKPIDTTHQEFSSRSSFLEDIIDKSKKVSKVETIEAEKHEIESLKDVSVLKTKSVSEVIPSFNGSAVHEGETMTDTSKFDKILNGSTSEPKKVVEEKAHLLEKSLVSDIQGGLKLVSSTLEETKVSETIKTEGLKESSHRDKATELIKETSHQEASSSHQLTDTKMEALTDISMIKDMTASFISTERWTDRHTDTPGGRATPSSEATWRESDDDLPASPLSTTSHLHSPPPVMSSSMYAQDDDNDLGFGMPDIDFETAAREHEQTRGETLLKDPIEKWGKPLGLPPPPSGKDYWSPFKEWGRPLHLPSPAPAPLENDAEDTSGSAKTTPKKVAKMNEENNKYASNIMIGKEANNRNKRSESPVKRNIKDGKKSGMGHIYLDLSYVPHHGNSHYANVEFFKRVRARYYVFSGTEPSKEVFNALLEAKQQWDDKDLEVTIIPTYDTDTLGYWIAENEETLSKYKIDLSPSASRCTINLQDHDTSCSAYRLEF